MVIDPMISFLVSSHPQHITRRELGCALGAFACWLAFGQLLPAVAEEESTSEDYVIVSGWVLAKGDTRFCQDVGCA